MERNRSVLNHFVFLEAERDITSAISGYYDFPLVFMSVLMAILSAYAAFLISERLRATEERKYYLAWLISGALTLGGGVWAMHFIGMLAYKLPITVNYDAIVTLISMIPAVLASTIILRVTDNKKLSIRKLFWLSVFMGGGIGLMHYVGMMAMHMDGFMRYEPTIFALSIIVAIVLAGIAIRLKIWADNYISSSVIFSGRLLIASIIMGCAIAGMHYTGMASMSIFLEPSATMQVVTWSAATLTNAIIIVVSSMIFLMVTAIVINRRFDLYQQIKDSESRNRVILSNILGVVITIDDKGIIQTVNAAIKNVFGYSVEEIIGQNIKIIVPEPHASEHDSYLKNYHDSGIAKIIGSTRTTEGRHKDGHLIPVELDISELEQHGQRMYLGIVRDITERKQAESELEQYRNQLEELVHKRTLEMKSALDEAERSNMAKSDFLSHMSHELRTPLNAIIGFGQMLELDAELFNETQQGNVKEILDAGHHLLVLINDVLDLAKIESGKLEVSMEAVKVCDVLQQCITLVQSHADKRQIEIIDNLSDKGYCVHADYTRLKQVFLNLLSNAVKYNRDSGRITVDSELTKEQNLRISITDTGEGLTKDEVAQLFTPFERVDEFNNVEGTGIGLVITKNLIELMDGSLDVNSNKGEGTTFWIELASNTLHKKEMNMSDKSEESSEHPSVNTKREHAVLYIEDNPANLRLVTQLLGTQPNICLHSAEEPFLGIELAIKHMPDLILLDINLPGIDGYEVLTRLREQNETKHIPVIAISANAMKKDIDRGLAAGFESYITKPIDVKALLHSVNTVLE